jgi:hypothetical protein
VRALPASVARSLTQRAALHPDSAFLSPPPPPTSLISTQPPLPIPKPPKQQQQQIPAPTQTNTNNNNQVLNTTNNNGVIYQIVKNADNSLSRRNVYIPPSRLYPIYAPDRKIREHGIYEPQPIYVPNLIGWSELVALILNK